VKHIVRMAAPSMRSWAAPNTRHPHPLRERRCAKARFLRGGIGRADEWASLINEVAGPESRAQITGGHSPAAPHAKVPQRHGPLQAQGETARWHDLGERARSGTRGEIPLDFDSLAAVGSMAGSGGVIVLDDTRDMGVDAQ